MKRYARKTSRATKKVSSKAKQPRPAPKAKKGALRAKTGTSPAKRQREAKRGAYRPVPESRHVDHAVPQGKLKRAKKRAHQPVAPKAQSRVHISSSGSHVDHLIPQPKTSSEKAKIIWLKRNQAKAQKLAKKKRPTKKEIEQLKILEKKIQQQKAALVPGFAAKAPAAKPLKVRTLSRKQQAEKAQSEIREKYAASQRELQARQKELDAASKAFLAEEARHRVSLNEQFTSSIQTMKDRLLELRDQALSRGEVEKPRAPYRRPLRRHTDVDSGQKIHIPGQVFIGDPGSIEQIMFDARTQSLKLTPVPGATWMGTLSMLVYGQATFGSPPRPWTGTTADASLFQVQSFESTGARPTRLGMLDALEDKLESAAETPKSVVWLEFITLQQFSPHDTEEKKEWRRAQARKKRKLATRQKLAEIRKRKHEARLRKKRRVAAAATAAKLLKQKLKTLKNLTTPRSYHVEHLTPQKPKKKLKKRLVKPLKKNTTKKGVKPPKATAKGIANIKAKAKGAAKTRGKTKVKTKTKKMTRPKKRSSSR